MKKLMLIAALVCGAFFVNSCDKDDNGGSGKDPVTNLADYLDKPYSLFASDCEKAGYIKTIITGGSGPSYGYAKIGYSITAIADASKNSITIMNISAVEVQTNQQLADHLRKVYTSMTGRYGSSELTIYMFKWLPEGGESKRYASIDELCTAITAVPYGTHLSTDFSFKGDNKGQEFYLEYDYSYDDEAQFGTVIETYYSPSIID